MFLTLIPIHMKIGEKELRGRSGLRAGWHCNPGAAYGALGLSEEKIAEQIRNHKCFSSTCVHQTALTVVNGVMAGAVRISLGFMTTFEDCDRVVDFFRSRYRM
ncbi:aminotransferase class 5 [Blastocystis sp. ATCC 50177/Nand II]|uniref:Aminotransferase class 5 n=1 Tax=Blastocystis sp. subtype 1 (strain ATCC 50177 / NandII) TaxID=478820 RepID=A0A196SAK8_BLAHN|nr:aminotransferase class 5 [Blastocystis sp. ATCC 50177/Nand II]